MKNKKNFYIAFEDKFRGSRELIKQRLSIYAPLLDGLSQQVQSKVAIDLGCGRGEWLEVLREHNFEPRGVDINGDMVSECSDLGLNAICCDAIEYLKKQKNNSIAIVAGFHIAEHLPFDHLEFLVRESIRALVPGGLLILETPNPENILVGSNYFYLDPTHQRPIPPQLLQFLPEYYGFERIKLIRLQESPSLVLNPSPSLLDVLSGVSPDYAIVAQKKNKKGAKDNLEEIFSHNYGLSLGDLTNKYSESESAKILTINENLHDVNSQLINLNTEKSNFQMVLNEELDKLIVLANQRAAEHAEALAEANNRTSHWNAVAQDLQQAIERRAAEHTEALAEANNRTSHWNAVAQDLQQAIERRAAEHAEALAGANKLNISITNDLEKVNQQNHHHYVLSSQRLLEITKLSEELRSTQQQLHQVNQYNHHHYVLSNHLQNQIHSIYRSFSWKVTKPLRAVRFYVGKLASIPKKMTIFIGLKIYTSIAKNPRYKHVIVRWIVNSQLLTRLFLGIRSYLGVMPINILNINREFHFKDLESVKIFSEINNISENKSITYLEKNEK
jgi:SAM-dependent methyltransferase